jgi:hypothetical protein
MVFSIVSGSLAYSGFSGAATTNVSATADFIGISEGICFVSYWSDNTAINVQGHSYPGNSCGFTEFCPPLQIVNETTSYSGVLDNYLNISNLAPGNAVSFRDMRAQPGQVWLHDLKRITWKFQWSWPDYGE